MYEMTFDPMEMRDSQRPGRLARDDVWAALPDKVRTQTRGTRFDAEISLFDMTRRRYDRD